MPLILNLQRAIRYSFSDGTPWRAGCVALVVGTILNLINQGDAIFGATPINWTKIVLTYLGGLELLPCKLPLNPISMIPNPY